MQLFSRSTRLRAAVSAEAAAAVARSGPRHDHAVRLGTPRAVAAGAVSVNPAMARHTFQTTATTAARVMPSLAGGPAPAPPSPTTEAEQTNEERAVRISRRAKLREHLHGGRRFYRGVDVKEREAEDAGRHLQVLLDGRPLRHPATKTVLRLPTRKRLLAYALAVEWDLLGTVRQATQGHRIALTSLVCRALDLGGDETTPGRERDVLVDQLLRYLDTDSLLCWAPRDEAADAGGRVSLRTLQEQTAAPIVAHVAQHVWPGVPAPVPVLGVDGDEHALFPRPQPAETRAAAEAWLRGLSGWALAGTERATLAGKSLVVAARLVTAAGTDAAADAKDAQNNNSADAFGVDDAVRATSLETAYQTAQWGAVEDTHDVDDADLRRHFGSVVLLMR